MPTQCESSPTDMAASLQELLNQHPKTLRDLFIKTLMLHAGYQIGPPKSEREVIAIIRKDLEQSLKS